MGNALMRLRVKIRMKLAGEAGVFLPYRAHFYGAAAMNTPTRLAAFVVAAVLACPAALQAAYDDTGVSARVTGLGRAYTAVADDVYSIYYNPAGLATLERREFGTAYSRLLTGLSDGSSLQNSFLGYAHPVDDGRKGTLGAAWNYFTLDGLYKESSFFASYGRRVNREDRPAPVFVGATLKFLDRSLGGSSAANNAVSNTGVVRNIPDPVLKNASRMNYDADLGVLWRPRPRWSLGLSVQHVLEPNVAFASNDKDKLGRNIKLGGAYKTPFSTLTGDLDFRSAPDRSLDKVLAVGLEKWLPTLLHGSFGVRGALSLGTRDHREISTGLSYKIHRMQVDYGFSLPVGGLASTGGSHRLGLTWRFGAPRQADALLGEMLLENLFSPAPVGSPEFNQQASELVAYKRKAVEALMRDADAEAQLGRLAKAHERSRQAASLAPRDVVLTELDERYRTAAAYFPDLSGELHRSAGAASHDGVMKFIAGKDRDALVALANGRALTPPPTPAHDGLIRILEAKVGAPAPAVSSGAAVVQAPPSPSSVEISTPPSAAAQAAATAEALKRVLDSTAALLEVSFFQQEWDKVVKLAEQIIALDPANAVAYRRLAGAYHALKRPSEALKALKAAYALEPVQEERSKLRASIEAMKAAMERRARPAAEPSVRRAASPEEVERLYEAGVELYARGRLREAQEAFRRVLQLDANYTPAQRAYQRVQAEMRQSGGGQ